MEREERVEIHGLGSGGPVVNVIMKVPGISQFVEPYKAYREDMIDALPAIHEKAQGCPKTKQDGWMEDCNGGHPVWTTMAVMTRGALKEPTKSGDKAGQRRDPSVDFNYKWKVLKFIDTPTPKAVATNGGTVVQASMDDATIALYYRECGLNDRTAFMQAVAFGANDGGNVLTEQAVADLGVFWADMLNERAWARFTAREKPSPSVPDSPLIRAAQEAGAVVTDVIDLKEDRDIEETQAKPPSIPNMSTEEQFKEWAASKNYKKTDIIAILEKHGASRVSDYISQDGKTAYGLALIVHDSLGDDVSW